ncbi:hypothetical protein DPEC_G00185730 [Dallia pectoralis]|uniref:Uncharacterized protein n=1 Tax=Dallia pectoralis TaxID=75939 RepID=A0ACC2GBC8_DALPE|nr:hypothetical protein DPEC_G00185730 [Dallia pectoralis]
MKQQALSTDTLDRPITCYKPEGGTFNARCPRSGPPQRHPQTECAAGCPGITVQLGNRRTHGQTRRKGGQTNGNMCRRRLRNRDDEGMERSCPPANNTFRSL